MRLVPPQRGQLLAQPSDPRSQGGPIHEAAGGACDESRLRLAHGQATVRVFHSLGVELTLEDAPRDDHLGDFIRKGVHHRVLPAVVHEDAGAWQELGDVESGRAGHHVVA